jgi:hypothetical protein
MYNFEPAALNEIEHWPSPLNFHEFMEFVRANWQYANSGYFTRKGETYYLSTAGMSRNEDIIASMQRNEVFWLLYWESAKRGGHYVFCPIGVIPSE